MPGDTVAQNLYNSIINNATYATALAFAPHPVKNYNPIFAGYNVNTDPECEFFHLYINVVKLIFWWGRLVE